MSTPNVDGSLNTTSLDNLAFSSPNTIPQIANSIVQTSEVYKKLWENYSSQKEVGKAWKKVSKNLIEFAEEKLFLSVEQITRMVKGILNINNDPDIGDLYFCFLSREEVIATALIGSYIGSETLLSASENHLLGNFLTIRTGELAQLYGIKNLLKSEPLLAKIDSYLSPDKTSELELILENRKSQRLEQKEPPHAE